MTGFPGLLTGQQATPLLKPCQLAALLRARSTGFSIVGKDRVAECLTGDYLVNVSTHIPSTFERKTPIGFWALTGDHYSWLIGMVLRGTLTLKWYSKVCHLYLSSEGTLVLISSDETKYVRQQTFFP